MGKAIKLQNKKTGENLYPISASDLVFDPVTKKTVKADLAEKIGDAPSDGKQYARKDGVWNEVNIPESGIGEAPKDGMQYVRKDGEWEKISPNEICQITLKSNQGDSDAASLIGASVKVIATNDSSELFNGTWNGETIIVSIQQGTEYKVIVGALDGYATPSEQTFTASAFVNRDVEVMYNTELVRVTLSADDSSSVSGQIVTINGEEFTYGSIEVEKKVPFGTEYTVSVNEKVGYITPSSQTFTASESMRNLEFEYQVPIGVYIVDNDGKIRDVSTWTGGSDCTGVYLGTDNVNIIIAPNSEAFAWGGYGIVSDTLPEKINSNDARNDFDGEGNTDKIIEALTGITDEQNITGAPAAEYCRGYSKGCKGVGEWYLPSVGEFIEIMFNVEKVNTALSKISGKTFIIGYKDESFLPRWTSNHNSDYQAICDGTRKNYFGDISITYWTNFEKQKALLVRPISKYRR